MTKLTVYTGSVPNKKTMDESTFALSVHGWLAYISVTHAPQMNMVIDEMDAVVIAIEGFAQTATDNAAVATTKANEAINSATNAANSANVATTKANQASTSAANAEESDVAAAYSANIAAVKAEEASQSAIDAENWARQAQEIVTGDLIDDVTPSTLKVFSSSKVKSLVDAKQDSLTIDSAPTENSTNPVQSRGAFEALALKEDLLPEQIGNAGKFLTTDGTQKSWVSPPQGGSYATQLKFS